MKGPLKFKFMLIPIDTHWFIHLISMWHSFTFTRTPSTFYANQVVSYGFAEKDNLK